MLTVAEVQTVIKRQKQLVAPMAWAKKLNHTEPVWFEYRSALEFEDDPTETPEGLFIVCQWKRKEGSKPENWTFGLLYRNLRIYAIDVQPLASHKHEAGKGKPFHRLLIRGNHEHTWSEEGYGYAEPVNFLSTDGAAVWSEFQARAGIVEAPFVHPDKAINNGQQELGI